MKLVNIHSVSLLPKLIGWNTKQSPVISKVLHGRRSLHVSISEKNRKTAICPSSFNHSASLYQGKDTHDGRNQKLFSIFSNRNYSTAQASATPDTFPITTLTRIIVPADTQFLGMIHGGILLRLIEEAGDIAATKYCNRYLDLSAGGKKEPVVAVLAGVEQTDFIAPMRLGDMVELEAQVTYTSKRSLQVVVNVYGTTQMEPNSRKLSNRSVLWYVPVNIVNPNNHLQIQPMTHPADPAAHSRAHASYLQRKAQRESHPTRKTVTKTCLNILPMPGIPHSSASSSYIIHPMYCGGNIPAVVGGQDMRGCQICKGGVLLRWMDDITAAYVFSQAGTACVTASLDSAEFYTLLPVGSYVTITVRPVFSSARTVDMQATAYVERFDTKIVEYMRVADAFFTFALFQGSAFSNQKEMIHPAIEPNSEEDRRLFEARKKRYEDRKAAAAAKKKAK